MSLLRPFLLFLGLVLAGCGKGPGPVLDLKISDGDWSDYNRSLEAIAERQTPEERVEFAKALQELKYHAMSGEGESPGPGVNASIREQVAGRSVRQVLVTGLSIKLGRKQEEEKALVRSILMNHRLRTKPGDDASADFLESVRRNQAKQLKTLRDEISALTRRLEALTPPRPGGGRRNARRNFRSNSRSSGHPPARRITLCRLPPSG